MTPDTFLTIARPAEGIYKEKGSRFLSFAFPVRDEEEIKTIVAGIRKEHFSARHCCFAWSLGTAQERYRVNDDGEPSGTAGRPIYGQIQSGQLKNILLVVVRYFGGTLLGVSGLISAYRQAAADAISSAEVVTQTIEHTLEINFNYALMNSLMQLIKEEQLEIVTSRFEMQCMIRLRVRSSKLEEIKIKLDKISGVETMELVE